jgi:formylglycine-generating enzyme
MKRITWILLAVALLLGSCTPASTPTATSTQPSLVETPTSLPASRVPPTSAPTLVPVALAGPQAGTSMSWLDGGQLVYVPSGGFTMGTGAANAPQKNVSLDNYWIYKTDVTNKMYAQCIATGNCAPPAQELGTPVYSNSNFGDYPVVGVTWDMAANYCKWAQGQLPTEAQWEKAARGSQGSTYPWGSDSPGCDLLNFLGCLGHTTSVSSYPNGNSTYGLLDMAGNVFQWVNDFYDEHYFESMPAANPTGPASGASHGIRGASFESDTSQIPSGTRHFGAPAYHNRDLGFRCVVAQPKMYAPYCQTNAYFPTAAPTTGACQSPAVNLGGTYCSGGLSYATVNISQGATYTVNTKGYSCDQGIFNGSPTLTCNGPDDSTGQLTVCNTACSGSPSSAGASAVCDPGYARDTSTGACLYKPLAGQPGVSGCPQGYNLIDRGGQKVCALGRNQNGVCPTGLYFDSQYGACIPPSGSEDAPYGLDNPGLASQTFQGCAPGYSYSSNFQCCQANTGGAYQGCALGYTYDTTQKACIPSTIQSSVPGCITVSLFTAKCGVTKDFCSTITAAPVCIRSSAYGCTWNTVTSTCSTKKKNP